MLKEKLAEYIDNLKREGCEKLPPDRKLCDIFNVSRPTIMKELARLTGEGVIVRKKGSGTFISEKDPVKLSKAIGAGFRNALYYPDNDHFLKIVNNISMNCQDLNIELQLFDRLKDMFARNDSDNTLLKNINTGILDGFLFGSRMPIDIASIISRKIPVVSLNNIIDTSEIASVSCDFFSAGHMAAEYLCEMGHREIGLMAGDQNHPEVWKNISAIKKVFQRQNISFNPDNLAIIKGAPDNKLRKIKDFINKRKVTAIYFINDILPQSLNSLAALNDISIIVSGNLGNCERYGITSIDTKIEEVCKTGVKLLSDKINGLKIKNNYILIEPEIIERGSVRKI